MKIDRYTKLVLTLIAVGLCAIALEQSSPPSAAAAETFPADASVAYRDAEFVPAGNAQFIMINRRTGDFALFELNAPHNEWKWQKLGPTGHLAALNASPTTAP